MTTISGVLFVSESDPSSLINEGASIALWAWLNPSNGEIKKYNTSSHQFDIAITHTHAEHGDINFTGSISAEGYAGHNGRETVGDKKLTFKEGICVLVEDA